LRDDVAGNCGVCSVVQAIVTRASAP